MIAARSLNWFAVAQRSAAQRRATRRAGSPRCRPTTRWRCRRRRWSSSPASRARARRSGPGQVEALLRIDARLEPIIAQLTQQYTANYQKSTGVESRLWHAVFDLVKAFTAAYQARAQGRVPAAPTTSAGARCCRGCWCGSRTTRASTASSGCSATATGSRRSGASSTSSTSSRGCAAGSASSSCSAPARSRGPASAFEQEYLKTLLLMRLDSGNFTPDQVEWVARQLEDWSPSLTLVPPPGDGAPFLRRPHRHAGPAPPGQAARPAGACCSSTPARSTARIVERMRWLPEQDDGRCRSPASCRRASSGCC